ncbi:hypothetical protein H6G41_29815 [Tolypothrix sp. FACHB-123]|uniref:hypothetical protein n=1 Tax=Tolypothrix sp. FACHB-123 TaxID=2692868 RepID=UPI001686D6D8|nr:hypothetical protein [Tolypothrix sp. FACHB-123]MBD2358744.1 hypothetical protein [Tolypothrix sp. FACHB-123]
MDLILPILSTKETVKLRSDYPNIEHLEAGNTAAWLQERLDQLLIRAKEERAGMNLAKFLTLGTAATGAICYATSPLAPIGALVAFAGYVWSLAQDINDTHQFAPIPFIRGNLIEFLSAMGDSEARVDWFNNQNALVDLMCHLEPMERFEFAMLKQSAHILTDYLAQVSSGKRFYAYRWILDWFIQLKGNFPSPEQLHGHLATVTVDPRINEEQVMAIQESITKTSIGIPAAKFASLPVPKFVDLPTPGGAFAIAGGNFDLITAMSARIQNHLIIGQQGSGKGLIISNVLDGIKQRHTDTTIFYIDPKGDEKETGYFTGKVDVLKRAKVLEWNPSKTVEWFKATIKEFQAIPGQKLLILDEATYLSSLMKNEGEGNWFKTVIMGLVSVGDSAGWNIWIVALNPNTDDIGVSGGVRSQFIPLALITSENLAPYTALISTQWLPKDKKLPTEDIQQLCGQSAVKRCYYYGKFNEWLPLPKMPNFSGYDRDSRRLLADGNEVNQSIQDTVHPNSLYELSEPIAEPLNQLPDKGYGDLSQSSLLRFTPLNLTREQVLGMIEILRTELNQTEMIERLWQCKKGGSAAWKEAYAQFKELMGER